MIRIVAVVALLELVACSSKHETPPPAPPAPLVLVTAGGYPEATLTPEDLIMGRTPAVIGSVDWKTPAVVVGSARETLSYDLEDNGVSVVTAMGTFHVKVDDASGELFVNDKSAGKLSGFSRTKRGWERLAALVLALPMLPAKPTPPPPPATFTPDEAAPPPPPPPSHGR